MQIGLMNNPRNDPVGDIDFIASNGFDFIVEKIDAERQAGTHWKQVQYRAPDRKFTVFHDRRHTAIPARLQPLAHLLKLGKEIVHIDMNIRQLRGCRHTRS